MTSCSMNRLIRRHGIPIAIYSDRHPVFKFTGDIDRYPAGPTQFARAMEAGDPDDLG